MPNGAIGTMKMSPYTMRSPKPSERFSSCSYPKSRAGSDCPACPVCGNSEDAVMTRRLPSQSLRYGTDACGPRASQSSRAAPSTVERQLPGEHLYLGDPHLRRGRAGGGAVGCRARIVVLLTGVQRVAGALAAQHPDAQVGGLRRRQVEV